MKIKVAKGDLESAIQVATIGVGGGEDDNLSTHYLFRNRDGKVELLASNGQRLLASAQVVAAEITDADDGAAFTVAGWRLRQWLGAVGDEVLTLEFKDGIVRASAARGSIRFGSLNPKDFPFWDDTLKAAKSVAKIPSARLSNVLAYCRNFVSAEENRSPQMAATECRQGTFNATDAVSVSLVTVPGLEDSSMRVHGKDAAAVISFLGLKGSDEVEILEHDRCLFLRRGDGSLLGVSRWMHDFPNLKLDKNEQDRCWFSVSTEDLTSAMRFLSASAVKGDMNLHFRFDNGKMVLSMTSASGAGDQDEQAIQCIEHENMDLLANEGYTEFVLSKKYVEIIAAQFGQDTLKFGVSWTKRNGYVRFRHERDGDDYLTIVVWARK